MVLESELDTSVIIMTMIVLFPIFWGVTIGNKVGLKYWLYDSFEGFNTSIGIPLGGFLSFIQIDMLRKGEDPSLIFLAICVSLFIYWSSKTYITSVEQTSNKKDAIGLFLGKTVFAVATMGLILLLVAMFSQRKKI